MTKSSPWHDRAWSLRPAGDAFIEGAYRPALSGQTFAKLSPLDGRSLAQVASCQAEDIEVAVQSARDAFESGRWSALRPVQRKRILKKFAELLLQHKEELALLETLDMGKPISESLRADVPGAARCIEWYAEAIDKVYGEVAPTGPGSLATITREPLGVVGAIVPWNFPLLMAAWKIGPILAAGNSLVLKPSEKSPLGALRVAQLANEAGVPAGVFNVVPGFGPTAGRALALSMQVDAIAFTGSTITGKSVMRDAAESNMKRVGLECGGKSANIIMADCPDLDAAAAASAAAIFYNQGEMCSAGSRLLVHRSVKPALLERLQSLTGQYQPGDPLEPSTRLGALVDAAQLSRVQQYVLSGLEQGAMLRCGGERVREQTGGFFFPPTIFDEVQPEMRIAQEEIFGPVLSIIEFETVEQAIGIANGTEYGLAAAVWSRDISLAHRTAKALRAGTVYVNCYDADDITVPFGGFKQSGIGRDKSLHALDKYTELKTTWLELL
jgi:4-guanidinobutyraldehyde dehydrogenase/NAD-dependent aldehyde dehydrogenase